MWGRGLLPDLQRGTSENIKQPYSLGWFVLLGRTCCNKGRYCPSISGNIWKETHNCSIPTNKVLETRRVFLELIPAQTESSNLRSWVFLSPKHFIGLIGTEKTDTMLVEFISNSIAQGVGGTFFPDTCAQTSRRSPDTPPPPQPSLQSMISSFWRQKSKYRHQNSNIWCQKVKILCYIQIWQTKFKLNKLFVPFFLI